MPAEPLAYDVDLDHGGRWTSLATPDREWLWHRPDPARDGVRAGAAFVDAGGLEECVPTVRGEPDHGAAWSRPWRPHADGHRVRTEEFELRREIGADGEWLVADYRLIAAPGYQFVWAAHASLDLTRGARIDAPAGTPTRVYTDAADWLEAARRGTRTADRCRPVAQSGRVPGRRPVPQHRCRAYGGPSVRPYGCGGRGCRCGRRGWSGRLATVDSSGEGDRWSWLSRRRGATTDASSVRGSAGPATA